MISQRILQSQLKIAKADTRPNFFYNVYKAAPKEKLFFNPDSCRDQRFKKGNTHTQARQKSTQEMTQTENIKMVGTHEGQKRLPLIE